MDEQEIYHDNINKQANYAENKSETFEREDKLSEEDYIGSKEYLEDK